MTDELKQIHISDFYWFAPSESIITFAPKVFCLYIEQQHERVESICVKNLYGITKKV